MMRFELIDEVTKGKITVEVDEELGLDQVLGGFEAFLRGAGFVFDGQIDVVEPYNATDLN